MEIRRKLIVTSELVNSFWFSFGSVHKTIGFSVVVAGCLSSDFPPLILVLSLSLEKPGSSDDRFFTATTIDSSAADDMFLLG